MSDDIQHQGMINYWQNESQSASHKYEDASRDAHESKMELIEAQKRADRAFEQLEHYHEENEYLMELGNKLADKVENLQAQLAKAKSDLEHSRNEVKIFEECLKKPLSHVSQCLPHLKTEYDADRLNFAEWIISQKSFKEAAIIYGQQLGKTKEEVMAYIRDEVKPSVLNDTTLHGNNASDMEFLKQYVPQIKEKLNKK